MLPVVFVPGIFGSVPLLRGKWSFGPSVWYYKPVIQAMKDAGMIVEIAYYAWWESNLSSARKYLLPAIDRANRLSGENKVVIVCHSMGGILARSYIQSDFYRNDVERVIMLCTPNQGSVNAYYPWEGGQVPPSAYEDFLNMLYNGFIWMISRIAGKPVSYTLIREYIPSIKELLPTLDYGDYLFEYDDKKNLPVFIPQSMMQEKNDYLSDLNAKVEIIKKRGIDIFCFNGRGYYTNKYIQVDMEAEKQDDLWVDGKPMAEIRSKMGDGTVLASSSRYIFDGITLVTSHMGVLKDSIPYLLKELKAKGMSYISDKEISFKEYVAYVIDKKTFRKKLLKECHDVFNRFEWGIVLDQSEFMLEIPCANTDMCLYAYNNNGSIQTDLRLRDAKSGYHRLIIKNIKGFKPTIEFK